ncbi:MAG: 5-hydroxyisourate hydrolase, partial [Variovorax paradoxus]
MGLSTHVLDTMHGCPAAGMDVALYITEGESATLVRRFTLNHDGRSDAPLYDNSTLKVGTYRLVFDVAGYFKARGVALPQPNFLNRVALDFG